MQLKLSSEEKIGLLNTDLSTKEGQIGKVVQELALA